MAQEAQSARGACARARAARARHGAGFGRSNDLGQPCGWLASDRRAESLVASRCVCVREMEGVTAGHGDAPALQETFTAWKRPQDDCLRPSRDFGKPVPFFGRPRILRRGQATLETAFASRKAVKACANCSTSPQEYRNPSVTAPCSSCRQCKLQCSVRCSQHASPKP